MELPLLPMSSREGQIELTLVWIMGIEAAKKSTSEDDKSHPKVRAEAVKHSQLLGFDCRTAVETSGKKNGQPAEFRLTLGEMVPSMVRPSTRHWSLVLIAATQRCLAGID